MHLYAGPKNKSKSIFKSNIFYTYQSAKKESDSESKKAAMLKK